MLTVGVGPTGEEQEMAQNVPFDTYEETAEEIVLAAVEEFKLPMIGNLFLPAAKTSRRHYVL